MKDKYPVLDKVDFPSDLKLLAPEELLVLSEEIRNYIIESVSITGGHLAAGLGTVELTIALHYIFDKYLLKISPTRDEHPLDY